MMSARNRIALRYLLACRARRIAMRMRPDLWVPGTKDLAFHYLACSAVRGSLSTLENM